MGLHFFGDMVSSDHHTNYILELFFQTLSEEETQNVNFLQDNITVPHITTFNGGPSQSFWSKTSQWQTMAGSFIRSECMQSYEWET
jgi:hypothetical protein